MKANEKGITLIVLAITVIVMSIIAGTVIEISMNRIKAKNLLNLYTDLESLEDKISVYYNTYGTIPVKEKFEGTYKFKDVANVNDNENEYYVIDINKLENLVLAQKLTWTGDDVYIINLKTHTIYYPKGVTQSKGIFYTLPEKYSPLPEN